MEKIDQLMRGAVDLHIHSGPGLIERSLNHVEACEEAMAAGMKAIVLKDHHCSTADLVFFLEDHIIKDNPLKVYGGLCLNNAVGGVNPRVVEAAIGYGVKIIWMPTLSAQNHKIGHNKQTPEGQKTMPKAKKSLTDPPLLIMDRNGRLLPEIKEICQMIAQADIILASGHIAKKEMDLLIEEARVQGVRKIMINHPQHLYGATLDDMREYTRAGIYLEHGCALVHSHKLTYEYIYEMIRAGGAEHSIICSDLGQIGRPRPVAGIKLTIEALLKLGLTEGEIKTVLCDNPAKLLGLA